MLFAITRALLPLSSRHCFLRTGPWVLKRVHLTDHPNGRISRSATSCSRDIEGHDSKASLSRRPSL